MEAQTEKHNGLQGGIKIGYHENKLFTVINVLQIWFYVDRQDGKVQFDDFTCKRLDQAGSGFKNEKVINLKDEENQEWTFDLEKMKCTRHKISYQLCQEGMV